MKTKKTKLVLERKGCNESCASYILLDFTNKNLMYAIITPLIVDHSLRHIN